MIITVVRLVSNSVSKRPCFHD